MRAYAKVLLLPWQADDIAPEHLSIIKGLKMRGLLLAMNAERRQNETTGEMSAPLREKSETRCPTTGAVLFQTKDIGTVKLGYADSSGLPLHLRYVRSFGSVQKKMQEIVHELYTA